jgi:glucan phosphorylase
MPFLYYTITRHTNKKTLFLYYTIPIQMKKNLLHQGAQHVHHSHAHEWAVLFGINPLLPESQAKALALGGLGVLLAAHALKV